MNTDTAPRALAVAALIAIFCSAMVAGAVHLLRPIQQGYQLIDRNTHILEAAGLLPADSVSDREIIDRFLNLEAHVVELNSGAYVPQIDAHTYDHWQHDTAKEQADSSAEPTRRAPVYLVRRDGKLARVVLPVHGAGMWDVIYGYLALEPDLTTVAELVIYRHGETAGIGDRIEDSAWLATWRGKQAYGADGDVRIAVGRRTAEAHGVDLITGASVTSEAVGTIVREWLGDNGYRPFLDELRRRESE